MYAALILGVFVMTNRVPAGISPVFSVILGVSNDRAPVQ